MKSSASKHINKFGNEASRRLYRGAADASRKLEHHLNLVNSLSALFSSETTDLRMRLKEYCERLIFTDPVEYGKKAEDLLWRKVYYDFFFRCKKNKKILFESDSSRRALINQILAGIGFYHHLLLRIQTEFHMNFEGKVDVPLLWHLKGVKKERWKKYQQSAASDASVQNWADQASHRILIYLGDLARYLSELDEVENCHIAERYYQQAYCINSLNGTPHNQLGSLYANKFESAYHYMRCLTCQDRFEGAEGNLQRMFEKNEEVLQQLFNTDLSDQEFIKSSRFLSRFLKLCQIFYFTPGEKSEIYCQDILKEFDMALNSNSNNISFNDLSSTELKDDVVFKIVVMSLMCVYKLQEKGHADASVATAFCLALFSHVVDCATRRLQISLLNLKEENLSQNDLKLGYEENSLIKNATSDKDRFNDVNFENDMNKDNLAKKAPAKKLGMKKFSVRRLRTLRRRRKMSSTSQEDSELSEGEITDHPESDEESGLLNSDLSQTDSESMSENEDDLLVEEEEEDDEDDGSNFHINREKENTPENNNHLINGCSNNINGSESSEDILLRKNSINNIYTILTDPLIPPEKFINILSKSKLLSSIKILCDWLSVNEDILSACAESSQFLLLRWIELLNILLKIENKLHNYEELHNFQLYDESWKQIYPLPEDIDLRGLPLLKETHSLLIFHISKRRELSLSSQVFLRIQCLLSFGKSLVKASESSVDFDAEKKKYYFNLCNKSKESSKEEGTSTPKSTSKDVETQKQKFMRSMAHLWLKAEVNDLETLVECGSSPQLSPYLVVDTGVLCCNLISLKQLVFSKRFIIVIPQIVIENLDQLKKDSIGAREAIRWLESELRKGCRYIRAQRHVEKKSLVPMKYPKKKEKDAWEFYQILECCNYLVEQQTSGKPDCSLVTLLVGSLQHLPDNAVAVAQSIDITIEKLGSFLLKWKSLSKNPG